MACRVQEEQTVILEAGVAFDTLSLVFWMMSCSGGAGGGVGTGQA